MDLMVDFRAFVCLCLITLTYIRDSSGFNCAKINSCKCRLDDGTVINLRPLGQKGGPK